MVDKEMLESLFAKYGYADYKWIKSGQIRVAQWVRFKCLFGCPMYGKRGTCPPNTPSIEQCREFFSEYEEAVIFHLEKRLEKIEDYKPWSREANQRLLELEREVFLAGPQGLSGLVRGLRPVRRMRAEPAGLCKQERRPTGGGRVGCGCLRNREGRRVSYSGPQERS